MVLKLRVLMLGFRRLGGLGAMVSGLRDNGSFAK